MAYDQYLADRIRRILAENRISFEEKKMMGGLCYMVDDKMCLGVVKDKLMARLDPDLTERLLAEPGCKLMDFTGKTMKGFFFIDPEGTDLDQDLEYWVRLGLEFNPKAKSSKQNK
jgi:TfoX/Sxy family transcriptional regulator of competence genes